MRSSTLTLAARYLFPVEGPPIADGLLTIEEGRIASVGPAEGRRADLDLGNVGIVPGFVNAHTHLELSAVGGEAEGAGVEDEVRWLRRVVEQRRERPESALRDIVRRNVESTVEAGTTLLADTATAGLSWDAVARAPVRAVVFAELIGLKRARG